MAQEVADLGQRDPLLDQARRVLVPEVVPMKVDSAEGLATLWRKGRPVARLPLGLDTVRLEHGRHPRRPEPPNPIADFIAEHEIVGRFLLTVRVELQPFEDCPQPGRGDRHEPRSLALGGFAAERDQPAGEVHGGEVERQHLALAHAGIQGGDDHRPQERRSHGQQLRLFIIGNPPPPLVVLAQLSNQRLRSAAERRAVDVLASDRPVHHVAQQLHRAVHRCGGQHSRCLAACRDVGLAQIRDEVLDVARSDLRKGTVAEILDDWSQAILDRLADRELLCEDVPFLVDVRELPQRQRRRLARRFDAALVERAVADGVLQVVEHVFCFGLRLDLAIGPFVEGDADVTEPRPLGMVATIARAALVLTELVQPHDSLLALSYDTPSRVRRVSGLNAARVSLQPGVDPFGFEPDRAPAADAHVMELEPFACRVDRVPLTPAYSAASETFNHALMSTSDVHASGRVRIDVVCGGCARAR